LRLFRLDRVLSVALCEASFVRPNDIDLVGVVQRGIANTPGTWLIEVLLHTDLADAKAHVAPDWATLEQRSDGVLLRCYSDDLDMIARSLVYIGRPMTVIRPPEMRDALRRLAHDVLRYVEHESPRSEANA
jgi:predicted DNA-binding transcriptional regulator YafY